MPVHGTPSATELGALAGENLFRESVDRSWVEGRSGSFLGKKPQNLTHHALSLVGREQELRVG
jgi:hypothetical protein